MTTYKSNRVAQYSNMEARRKKRIYVGGAGGAGGGVG